ncbi:MAG: lmo0937 family membrane protein [Chloroflexota bacterium]
MLLLIAGVIIVLWLVGLIAIPAAGALVHLLLVVALIVIVAHFLGIGRGRQTV